MSRQRERWWTSLTEDDPISLEPLALLSYPPFKLNTEPDGSGQDTLFDGRSLAKYIVMTGTFVHPISRRPLEHDDCAKLDSYMGSHGLRKRGEKKVLNMYRMSKAIAVKSTGRDGPTGQEIQQRRAATTVLSSLFSFSSGDADRDGGSGGRGGGRSGRGGKKSAVEKDGNATLRAALTKSEETANAERLQRNKVLITRMQRAVGGDVARFNSFRQISTSFRAGRLPARAYHVAFLEIFGDDANADSMWEDLVSMLPDAEKRSALLEVCRSSGSAKGSKSRERRRRKKKKKGDAGAPVGGGASGGAAAAAAPAPIVWGGKKQHVVDFYCACNALLAPYKSIAPRAFLAAPLLEARLAKALPTMPPRALLALRWMSRGGAPSPSRIGLVSCDTLGVSAETLGLVIVANRRYVAAERAAPASSEDARVQRCHAAAVALDELDARELFLYKRCLWHLGQTLYVRAGGTGVWRTD
jgi:hypothetical protein